MRRINESDECPKIFPVSLMRSLASLLGAIALAYLAVLALVYVLQARLLYLTDFGGRAPSVTPAAVGLQFEDVLLKTADGATIHGWFVPHPGARHTVVYFHGNAGHIGHRIYSIRQWHSIGVAVMIFDYHGYGRSEGRPSETATYQDAQAVWNYLTVDRDIDPAAVVLFGRSLGAAVATWLASRQRPGGLIIDSGFTSIPELAADIYSWLPARALARFDYDARAAITGVRCPVLIAHSPNDEVIPFHHGQALFEAASEPKRFIETAGGHNDGLLLSDLAYRAQVSAFLTEL